MFSTEEKLGALDISRFAELELFIRRKFFKSPKTKAPAENKRSQNLGFRKGKRTDFTIVSQVPTVT